MSDDPVRLEALLRLYRGEARVAICESLGVERTTLDDWEQTTPTSELRPPGLPADSTELRIVRPPEAIEGQP